MGYITKMIPKVDLASSTLEAESVNLMAGNPHGELMAVTDSLGSDKQIVVIQRNPHAGTARKQREILDLVRELKRLGMTPRLFSSRERLDRWMAHPRNQARVKCLVGAGGDGTLQNLISRHPGAVLSQLPIGTENVLARHLGIPLSGREVARMIAVGHVKQMDIGRWGNRPFVLMASVGFDAEVIHRAHAERSGHTSRWRYLWPIARALWNCPGVPLVVNIDDSPPRTAQMAVVVNVPRYALGLNMATQALDDDGLLEVRLFKQGSAWSMWRYFVHLCLGSHERLADVESVRGVNVRIESEVPRHVQVDGDPAGTTPISLTVMPGGVSLLVP